MRSESSKSFRHGFRLDEQELRRLYDVACQQLKNACRDCGFTSEFELKFQNGVIANPSSLDDIISQENIGSAAIRRLLMILVGNGDFSRYKVSIRFCDPSSEEGQDDKPITYKIEAEDRDWVFVTSSQLEERIGRIKAVALSRSFHRNLPLFMTQVLILIMLFVFLISSRELDQLSVIERQWNSKETSDLGQLVISVGRLTLERQSLAGLFRPPTYIVLLFLTAISLMLAGFSERITTYLFPPYNFLWGDYVRLYERRKSVRNFVLVVLVLGVVLSVVGNFIYAFLTRR